MNTLRLALGNLPFPDSPDDSVSRVERAVAAAAAAGARVLCLPECYVPGYRAEGRAVPAPDAQFLELAWDRIARAAAAAGVTTIVGTERIVEGGLVASSLVIGPDGERLGFQDKVQIDPSEEVTYVGGAGRQVFRVGELAFGVVICHEGWRYPETVRWAARRGAQVVFHPAFHEADATSHRPTTFAEAANTFHEKAALCRAAENTCYFATVNYASGGSPTTSAVVNPDGTVLAWQPYGVAGLLVADIDLDAATGLLARRCKSGD